MAQKQTSALIILLDSESEEEDHIIETGLIILESESDDQEEEPPLVPSSFDSSPSTDDSPRLQAQLVEDEEGLRALAEQIRLSVLGGDAQQAYKAVKLHQLAGLFSSTTTLKVVDQVYEQLLAAEKSSRKRVGTSRVSEWRCTFEALFQLLGEEGRAATATYQRLCVSGGTEAAWSGLGETCERLGKKQLAVRALGRAERSAVHSDWDRRQTYLHRRRQIYLDQGRVEDAHALALLSSRLKDEQLEHEVAAQQTVGRPRRLVRAYAQLSQRKTRPGLQA